MVTRSCMLSPTYAAMANECLGSVSNRTGSEVNGQRSELRGLTLTSFPCFTLYTLTFPSLPATQSHGSWVTGSFDQQLAQFASF